MAQLADAKAELAWLDAEGESRRLEKRLVGEREGLRKLELFCQTKARDEIACREESVLRYVAAPSSDLLRSRLMCCVWERALGGRVPPPCSTALVSIVAVCFFFRTAFVTDFASTPRQGKSEKPFF